MSIQSEINRIKQNINNAYDAMQAKGATIPSSKTSAGLAAAAQSIDIESDHKYIEKTLPSASWAQQSESEYKLSFTDSNIQANYKLEIGLDSSELLQIMNDGVMSIRADNNNGTAEVICLGGKPSIDLHSQISFVRVTQV